MRRFQTADDSERQARQRQRRIVRILFLAMVLLVSPLAYEWGNLTYSRWQGVMGKGYAVDTPVMNYLSENFSEFKSQFGGVSMGAFRTIEWKPAQIVPIAFGFAAFGAWFLRRGI